MKVIDRRTFLGATTGLLAAPSLVRSTQTDSDQRKDAGFPKPPKVGSQLYGWGQYYQRAGKDMWANLGEVLSAIRDSGYDYAEGYLDLGAPENNLDYADKLREKGMIPVSLYCGGALHENGKGKETAEKIVQSAFVARKAGFKVINCNPDPIGREKTDEELEVQSQNLARIGKELKGMGMDFGIHHHTPAMRSDAREFHSNFKKTDPNIVGFCYDVHWVFRGGMQPEAALESYGDRVVSWHLRQSRDGVWWEDLATGDIDYSAVAQFAEKHALPAFYTVELALEQGTKITRTSIENHRRSRDFVKAVFRV